MLTNEKYKRLMLLLVFISGFSNTLCAQIELVKIIKQIKWPCVEYELVSQFKNNVLQTEQEVWDNEHSESNYCFMNVKILDYTVSKSNIRVDRDTKQIKRINLIVLYEESDLNKYKKIESYLNNNLGSHLYLDKQLIWSYKNFRVVAKFIDLSNVLTPEIENYCYVIALEPIKTLDVNYSKAKIESNVLNKPIPQIEYVRIDSEKNIYIKEKDKNEIVMKKIKTYKTPKGEIIKFDKGMICHRVIENDIVFLTDNLAVTYPIL